MGSQESDTTWQLNNNNNLSFKINYWNSLKQRLLNYFGWQSLWKLNESFEFTPQISSHLYIESAPYNIRVFKDPLESVSLDLRIRLPVIDWEVLTSYISIYTPGGSTVNNSPAMQEPQEMRVQFLDQENPLEEEMATRSSVLSWRIPWTEEPGGLPAHGITNSRTQLTIHPPS